MRPLESEKPPGLVFVHGIVGNNRIFEFLHSMMSSRCVVRFVELKGHGGDALAFSRSSMTEWKQQVEDTVVELGSICSRVLGVGHSMGCLLLMEQAVKGNIARLFLLNPPLRIRLRSSMLINAFRVAVGRSDNNPVLEAAQAAYGISLDPNPLHYYGWPKRFAELYCEIRRLRKNLIEHLQCPVTAFLSERDEVVAVSSTEDLQKCHSATTVLLPTSTHYYYTPEDRRLITSGFIDFLSF